MAKQRPIFMLIRLGQVVMFALVISVSLVARTQAAEPATLATAPVQLIIPAIKLDSPVIPVGVNWIQKNGKTYGIWQVADNEVGWHNLSAPLGRAGNTVMAGHSNIYARVFRNLKNIELGDEIIAIAAPNGPAYRYIVTQKLLLREEGVSEETRIKNAQWILPTQDERLTLVTCAEPGSTHRLIVVAQPVMALD
jgi:LPXTG-site transpeptidase (sortase) family protein